MTAPDTGSSKGHLLYYRKDKVNHVPNNNEEVLPLKEEISYYFCNRENYPILP